MMNKKIFDKYSTILKQNDNQVNEKLSSYHLKYFKHFYLRNFPKNKDAKILDIGCGNGKYLSILKELGYKNSFGIDISIEQIEIAKKNHLDVKCIDSIAYLKENKDKYDIILLIDVLEHLDISDSFELIRLSYDTLNKNGKMFIQVPNALAPFSPLRYADITHQRAYTTYSLNQTINYSDFKKVNFYELYPFVHGFKSLIRNLLWKVFIKPSIIAFNYVAYGTNFNKIYTANFLSILEK